MINLIPSYTYDYDQLWILIERRNFWLIKLRFGAVAMLVSFLLGIKFLMNLEFSGYQYFTILIITSCIFLYNIIFIFIRKSKIIIDDPNKFNQMHFALVQIFLDLLALNLLVYYTGGIESPLYIFFIFHMIIGSLILPGYIIYSIAGIIVVSFTLFSFFEYLNIIPHYSISGLINHSLYDNIDYIIIFCSAFIIMMVVSVFLANSIASALYKREQELKITLDKLNEAEIAKQKYTMGIVHEIKSPISAVQSFLDIILQKFLGPISPEVEDKLIRARARCDESVQIINDVLHISKLKLLNKIHKEDIDIDELIKKVIEKRKIQSEYSNISLNFYDLRSDKFKIKGDAQLLELALSNLIGNAVKYTNENGKIEVVVDSGKSDREILIEICDNGIGIPEKDIDKLFQEFYRASNIKQRSYEGSGLGLSLVKQIIEQHDGSISVRSPSRLADNLGPGTCFTIKLPLS